LKTSLKHSLGTTNLNSILGSQNCVFKKVGIGYKNIFQKKVKRFNNFFNYIKMKASLLVTCLYCMRKGHSARICNIRKFDVLEGLVRWVSKGTINIIGPKFNRGPLLGIWFVLHGTLTANKQLWYLDSVCTKHMTGDASKLVNLTWKHGGFVTYGDNNRDIILGSGEVGEKDSLIIKDVLLVEALKHNLLSISQLCDRGLQVTFGPELFLISNPISRWTLLDFKRVNNVCMLNISYIDSSWNFPRVMNHGYGIGVLNTFIWIT